MPKLQKRPVLWAGALLVALLLAGCQGAGPGETTASASPTPTMFSGQTLPSKVEMLTGTPIYTSSEKMAPLVKLEGAPFLLMAPQEPTRALLVIETGSAPSALAGRPSELAQFSGTTELIEAPDLVKFVKDEMGVELKQDEAGKVVVLRVQPASAGATATTPAQPATATPGVVP